MTTKSDLDIRVRHTLVLADGATRHCDASGRPPAERVGVHESITTVLAASGPRDVYELLRGDLAGADFAALERAGALPELHARLVAAATALHEGGAGAPPGAPCVVVTLDDGNRLTGAEMVFGAAAIAAAIAEPRKRGLTIPRLLPYQLGGDAEGAHVVVYSPNLGRSGICVHSVHPTAQEADIVVAELNRIGEHKNMVLRTKTPVTALVADVHAKRFVAEVHAQADMASGAAVAGARDIKPPPRSATPFDIPSPFDAPTPYQRA